MKIVFLISSISKSNPGIGGHYYSLLETVERISEKHEVSIINIGTKKAISLADSKFKVFYVTHKKPKIITIYKQINIILKQEKADILHSFDHISHLWGRFCGNKLKIPYSLTKCGGVNPIYYPYAEHMVLYSEENRLFFQSKSKFKNSNIYLIPNRIQIFKDDFERIEYLREKLENHKNDFIFLRITRIKEYYHNSSIQLINLVNQLSKEGIQCSLIFIGTIESPEHFEELKEMSGKNCFFFTSSEITNNAKEIIDISDAVLGTGRGFMEAASKSKMLLAPNSNSKYPLLIDESNFGKAFEYNFSERICIQGYDQNLNYEAIKEAINNKEKLKSYSTFALNVFSEYFDTKKLNEKYEEMFIKMSSSNKTNRWDFILNFLFVLRSYYKN